MAVLAFRTGMGKKVEEGGMGDGGLVESGVGSRWRGGGRLTWTSSVSFPSGLFAEACICVIGI